MPGNVENVGHGYGYFGGHNAISRSNPGGGIVNVGKDNVHSANDHGEAVDNLIGGGTGNALMTNSLMSPSPGQGNVQKSFNHVHQVQHVNSGEGNMTMGCFPPSKLPSLVFQEQFVNGGTGTMTTGSKEREDDQDHGENVS